MTILRTSRLTGRPIRAEDWPVIHAIQTDPEHGYWVRGPNIEASEERSKDITARHVTQWLEGWGTYLLEFDGTPVGYAGLRRGRLEQEDVIEALWGIVSAHHRKGYATEAMRMILQTPPRHSASISAWTLPDNTPSRRLMQRLGFRFEREATYADLRHVVYRLTL